MEESIKTIGVMLSWTELGLFTILFAGVQFLLGNWMKNRITYSIKNEYDAKLEKIKAELNFSAKKREESALVAELLAEWVSHPTDKKQLNKLLWEATLWLPEQEAKDLNNLLANQGGITTKQMLIKVRAIIQGKDSSLKADDLTHF